MPITVFFGLFIFAGVKIGQLGREKFIHGEAHFIKQAAGIVLGRTAAFFFGNTEIVGGNDDLYVSHKSDYGEYSECGIEAFSVGGVCKAVKCAQNIAGKIVYVTATAAMAVGNLGEFCG